MGAMFILTVEIKTWKSVVASNGTVIKPSCPIRPLS
jgi:hypothetical protein